MTTNPKVSICIPTYSHAPYLLFAVKSALAQDYDNVEVVISDDSSTGEARECLASITDRRLRVVRPDRHLAMAENWGFCVSHCQGEYFNLLSNDDVLFPSYARQLAATLNACPDVAFAYCAAQLIDENGQMVGVERHIGGSFVRKGSDEIMRFIRGAGCVWSSVMIRRDCYERAGGFGKWRIVGDWDLELRLLQTGDVAYCDEVLVQYRAWTTPERESRTVLQLQEIAQLYETTVARIANSHHKDLRRDVEKCRRAYALGCALGMGNLADKAEFVEAASQILKISDSSFVRFVLQLHRMGLSAPIVTALRTKLWFRRKVKALLYQT